MKYLDSYFAEAHKILDAINKDAIDALIELLCRVRDGNGRLFILGVGGGAGHASHAVNDFRKICGIEAYAPTDNVSELTARINDDGWGTSYIDWLRVSKLRREDMVLVFSVGGGEENTSLNIVNALTLVRGHEAKIGGIVGPNGGYTTLVADACVHIPAYDPITVTPQTEGFQAMIWHAIVSHPKLRK